MPTSEDLVNTSGTESGQGTEIQRAFHVSNIGGNAASKPQRALSADKIPNLGDPHPSNNNLVAIDKSVNFIDSANARVTVTYRIPKFEVFDIPPGGGNSADDQGGSGSADSGTITVGASLTSTTTNVDRNGVELIVAAEVLNQEFNEDFTDTIDVPDHQTQKRTAEWQIPQTIIRVQRVEAGSPSAKARAYVGTVNSKALGKAETDGPRHWLCTRIDGVSNDGGTLYNVTYEFQHNRKEWGAIVEWIDPETGLPKPSADWTLGQPGFLTLGSEGAEPTERVFYETYAELDFADLNIFVE